MCEATVRLSTTVDCYVGLIINVHAQARGGMRALQDDVFAKSAKRVVKARDSRLRSRLVSIVLIVVTATVRVVR